MGVASTREGRCEGRDGELSRRTEHYVITTYWGSERTQRGLNETWCWLGDLGSRVRVISPR